MSGTPEGQGGFQQQHQNIAYNNGTRSYQQRYHQSTYTSASVPTVNQRPMAGNSQSLLESPLQQPLPFSNFGQQVHQNAMAMHQQAMQNAMQHHQAVSQSMQASLFNMQQALPATQPVYRTLSIQQPQPQIQYYQRPTAGQMQQIQYASTAAHGQQIPQAQSVQLPAPVEQAPRPQQVQYLAPPQTGHVEEEDSSDDDERLAEIEKRQAATEQQIQQGVQHLQDGLRRIADSHARSRDEQEAKDRELESMRKQLDDARRQQVEAEQRHAREISEIQQAQASAPRPHNPAVDMSAFRKVVEEVQRDTLRREDIELLIKSTLGKELAGVARASDLTSTARTLEHELKKLSDASADDIRHKLQQRLNNVVQDVADHVPMGPESFEASGQPQQMHLGQQPRRFQTSLGFKELPQDNMDVQHERPRRQKALPPPRAPGLEQFDHKDSTPDQAGVSKKSKPRLLTDSVAQEAHSSTLQNPAVLAEPDSQSGALTKPPKSKHSKSQAPVHTPNADAELHSKPLEDSDKSLMRVKRSNNTTGDRPRESSTSTQPPSENTVVGRKKVDRATGPPLPEETNALVRSSKDVAKKSAKQ